MPEKVSLACNHIVNATAKIEAWIMAHKPLLNQDSGKTFMCWLCKEDFENIIKRGDTTKFKLTHESHIKDKILNYE